MSYLDVFWKEKLICRIYYDLRKRKISFENYDTDIYILPFGKKTKVTFKDFEYFLEERCFPRTRYNCREILDVMGIDHYNPYDIVHVTHGIMSGDYIWVRFEGEQISYKDVKLRD